MRERRGVIGARVERVAHQLGDILFTAEGRTVAEGLTGALALQPTFAMQVIHHRHHRRVGDLRLPRNSSRTSRTVIDPAEDHNASMILDSSWPNPRMDWSNPSGSGPFFGLFSSST